MACSRSLAAQDCWLHALLDLNLAKEFWLIFYAIDHGLGLGCFDPLKLMGRCVMRITLQLDDDVLAAARVLARQELRSGLPQLPVKASGGVVDLELVNQLRDEEA